MQDTKPTILIFLMHTGGGHKNLALSLRDILGDDYTYIISDPVPSFFDRWYARTSRNNVQFLAREFKFTDTPFMSYIVHIILTILLAHRIRESIQTHKPQLLITTHSLLSYAIAHVDSQLPKYVPLLFQLTDLSYVHQTWFTEKSADAYLAPSQDIYDQAIERGISPERLYLTGRPTRRQFQEVTTSTSTEVRKKLNFEPDAFTIFLQGGAKGSAQIDTIIDFLLHAPIPVQIILAAGNNEGMVSKYADMKQIYVLPFTETIAPYMASADIIVGKAGASFVTEAFMLEKPFLVTAVIPDQETPTLSFIEKHNLGWVCLEAADQGGMLLKIAQNPELIAEKVKSIQAYKAWNIHANQSIPTIVDRLLPIRNSQTVATNHD